MEWTRRSFETALDYGRARALICALELDVFTPLDAAATGAEELARRLAADTEALTLLLDALAGLELLEKRDGVYALTEFSRQHLVAGRPTYLGDLGRARARNWPLWGTLSQRVRSGREPGREDVFAADAEGARLLTLALKHDALELAPAFLDRVEAAGIALRRHHDVLDVGGGHAMYAATLCVRQPHLRATVFDLPAPLRVASETARELGVEARVRLLEGDYRRDPLPPGHDLAVLSYVLHGAGPSGAGELLRSVHTALEPGGRLLVQELVLSEDRTQPPEATLFSLELLLHTEHGRALTRTEILAALDATGFVDVCDVGGGAFVAAKA